jgi:predicted DNA-binding transcriptional regulator YafY
MSRSAARRPTWTSSVGCSFPFRPPRWLAGRFEVSVRTVERDINALQQSGVPIYAEPGRTDGYCLDKARTLPPVNLTPGEAVAMAVALRRL